MCAHTRVCVCMVIIVINNPLLESPAFIHLVISVLSFLSVNLLMHASCV
jgi:hypothetical protein